MQRDLRYPRNKAIWLLLSYTQGKTALCLSAQPLQVADSSRSCPYGLERRCVIFMVVSGCGHSCNRPASSPPYGMWPPGRQDGALVIIASLAQCLGNNSHWRNAHCCINILGMGLACGSSLSIIVPFPPEHNGTVAQRISHASAN